MNKINMEDCVFCKILTGEVPSSQVFENEKVLAFLDINPVNPGHTLVIPKKHYENIEEIPEDILCEMIKAVKNIGRALKENIKVEGYNIGLNNGSIAGQIVPHVHFHVMPRKAGDGLKLWPQRKYRDEKEMEKIAEVLAEALDNKQ